MMARNEKFVAERLFARLDPFFTVDREVTGHSPTGDLVRIDAIVRPRSSELWKRPNVALGIEVKDADELQGDFKDAAAWFAQCVDYSYSHWSGYGRVPIFSYPPVASAATVGFDAIAHLLGQFGVGDLQQTDRYGLAFVMHQTHRIWSEAKGVEAGKRWSLLPRVGSGRRDV